MSEMFESLNQKPLNLVQLVKNCASKKMNFEEFKEDYNTQLNYHRLLLNQQTKQTSGLYLNQGLFYSGTLNDMFIAPETSELCFSDNSPLIDAIHNDNAELFEAIMHYYPSEALKEKDVLKTAVLAKGNYLNKIIGIQPNVNFSVDEIYEAFTALCQNDVPETASRVETLLKLFPNPKKYRTLEGKNLLMVAAEMQNDEVCALLTEKGFNPLHYTDSHCTKTIYGYCYEKLLKSAKNQKLKRIVSTLRKGIQSSDVRLKNWIEEKAFRSVQNQMADRRKIVAFAATVAMLALFGLHTCHSKNNTDAEKSNNPTMPQATLIIKKNPLMVAEQNQLVR